MTSSSGGPGLAHIVYFTLNDDSAEATNRLVAECQEYLTGHPGTAYFSVGTRVPDLTRPVNDAEFHVGLHVVFESRADHDRYQTDPRHVEFIERNKASWKQVRVFDSDLSS